MTGKTSCTIRTARAGDLRAMAKLEKEVFPTDRMSDRSFRELFGKKTARFFVAVGTDSQDDAILGYALVLFRKTTSVARLYSIAVLPQARGRGIARALLAAAEEEAGKRGELFMRLEARAGNTSAIELYKKHGYREFGRYLDYYEDHADAVRLEKSLIAAPPRTRRNVPYYHQTTNFTCGPSALMMAMAALGCNEPLSRELEFQLWREATSIYLISAPGGCEPIGMAVTAARRGYRAEVHVNQAGPYFTQVRQGKQRLDVMSEAQKIFARQARDLKIPISHRPLDLEALIRRLDRGAVAIVLISTHRMYGDRTPHWIVAYDHDSDYIFAHDPWVGRDDYEMPAQKAGIAIAAAEFEKLSIWGRSRLRAAVILERKPAS